VIPNRGEDPEKEASMEKILGRRLPSTLPLWSWLALALLLVALFVLLSASGALFAPLLGQAAGPFDYLHEFAHDGRHLLGVPCH
jgi:putative exporter of polyketide antibiotics